MSDTNHLNDILGISTVNAGYTPSNIANQEAGHYSRNITTAVDEHENNTYHHTDIQSAVVDAPPKHPIESMTATLGVNPPAGVQIEGVTGSTGSTGSTGTTGATGTTEAEGTTGATGETDTTEGGGN